MVLSGNDGEKMGDIVPVSWLHRTNKEYIYLLKFMWPPYTVRKIELFESKVLNFENPQEVVFKIKSSLLACLAILFFTLSLNLYTRRVLDSFFFCFSFISKLIKFFLMLLNTILLLKIPSLNFFTASYTHKLTLADYFIIYYYVSLYFFTRSFFTRRASNIRGWGRERRVRIEIL